jgi:hypothetical protein
MCQPAEIPHVDPNWETTAAGEALIHDIYLTLPYIQVSRVGNLYTDAVEDFYHRTI